MLPRDVGDDPLRVLCIFRTNEKVGICKPVSRSLLKELGYAPVVPDIGENISFRKEYGT